MGVGVGVGVGVDAGMGVSVGGGMGRGADTGTRAEREVHNTLGVSIPPYLSTGPSTLLISASTSDLQCASSPSCTFPLTQTAISGMPLSTSSAVLPLLPPLSPAPSPSPSLVQPAGTHAAVEATASQTAESSDAQATGGSSEDLSVKAGSGGLSGGDGADK